MKPSDVGVVVVNWNGWADTWTCLQSLVTAAPPPRRIVVVDNASSDGSVEALKRWRTDRSASATVPSVTILASSRNRGFAGANNLGIAHLTADPAISHFLLLNNDATVDPTFFAQIARALDLVPEAGIVGPTIYTAGPPREVWYAGGHFVQLRALVVHDRTVPRAPDPVATEFVTGCAMAISRSAWKRLGPLPECYFMYLEDAEYCARARAAGLLVLYVPRAVAYHVVGSSVARAVRHSRAEYWKARNRALFVRRNFLGWTRLGALGYLVLTKPGRALADALRGRPGLGWAVLRGTLAGLLSKHGNRDAGEAGAVQHPLDGVVVHE
jgi:GT2 family glycosyltransferase